ncbi:M16 family metallopeptidase [Parvularcula marina]|uniref:Insulinase family protein n=1 Tax=Parvularcula marina TaxID=2292771 RepID=A0A371RJ57_9PROT|nr:pitrilysin family protein [Parvularcula marina]RFB05478.1 insulinase family protein [Parvularcula marina]
MRRSLIISTALAAALALTACETTGSTGSSMEDMALPGGIKLVEKVTKKGDEVVIPYSKYVLPNGLTVILHEDDSDPLVHVDVTYHVGSGREEIGKSGFAHFFEHMMFQGSENVGDEEHFKIVSESGGTLNGTTNTDRTNYFETVPSNQLEKMIWLEADRMGFLLPAVTQEKFEVQRETVKNERGQNYDNRPYGLIREKVAEAMYPEGHPYSWLTIGYIEDLNRADLDDLKRFFLRWYGPNNAVLTIGGDLDKMQTLEWVNKYFGSIPAGPEVADPVPTEVTLDADRYISYEDNVSLPLVWMTFPTVHVYHPDEAPLDVLYSIMGDGRTSLLYKNMVKDGYAVQASASHGCSELHCQFTMFALPNPASGKSLTDLEQIMRDSLKEFEERGVLDDDLERVKAGIRASNIFGLESVRGKVSQLAAFATFADTPNYIQKEIDRYDAVTKEDVMRVYEKYIKDKSAVILSVVPKGQPDMVAAPDNWTFPGRTIPEASDDDSALALRIPADDFDRSMQPAASGENPVVTLPTLWRDELSNGVEVLGAINDETPTTAISLRIEVSQRDEPLEKLGLAEITAAMLNEATQESTNEELSNRLAKLGSSVSVSAGSRYTTITVRSLTENLDETLAIARERLLEPAFNEDDFQRVKGQTIEGIKQSKTQASATASQVFTQLMYGNDNAFAWRDAGRVDTVETITLDDVKAFYDTYYKSGAGSIIAVSDLPEKKMMASLAAFSPWSGDAMPQKELAPFPAIDASKLYLIDKPGAAQSEIRIGKRALPFDATGTYYKATLMNYALGGAFNSRINLNLREDKGYTYGARSFFSGSDQYGEYRAQAGVRKDATAASIVEFFSEIGSYQEDGISEDELAFTKQAIGQSEARDYETPFQKLGFLSQILTYDLPDDFVDEQQDILRNLTKENVDMLAAELLDGDMALVVVGDKEAIWDELEALGREIVELDENGMPK